MKAVKFLGALVICTAFAFLILKPTELYSAKDIEALVVLSVSIDSHRISDREIISRLVQNLNQAEPLPYGIRIGPGPLLHIDIIGKKTGHMAIYQEDGEYYFDFMIRGKWYTGTFDAELFQDIVAIGEACRIPPMEKPYQLVIKEFMSLGNISPVTLAHIGDDNMLINFWIGCSRGAKTGVFYSASGVFDFVIFINTEEGQPLWVQVRDDHLLLGLYMAEGMEPQPLYRVKPGEELLEHLKKLKTQ